MVWTAADRAKAAAKRRGKHLSAKARKKISSKLRGRHASTATKAKESKERKGKKHPHKGHPTSAATRKKLSTALKGKKHKTTTKRTKTRSVSTTIKHAVTARKAVAAKKKTPTKTRKPVAHRAKAKAVRAVLHHRHRVLKRLAQHFGATAQRSQHRKFEGLTNTAVLDHKLKTLIHGRRHGLTNKGVLHLSGHHHFGRHR